jgi:16S rRNA (guanine966-N2)-methyltransferase
MRIISGKFKSKKLVTLTGVLVTRPTSDRVKESIFNIIKNSLDDAYVLDLFSGSGALGLEAISRGAAKSFLVEKNKDSVECIKKNIDSLPVETNKYEIYEKKVEDFLSSKLSSLQNKITLVFADPPYQSEWYAEALEQIEKSGYCQDKCLLIIEMDVRFKFPSSEYQKNWEKIDSRDYGKTKIEIWQFNRTK